MEDEMKKTLFVLLIIGLVLFLAACNTNDGPGGGPGGEGGGGGEDAEWKDGFPFDENKPLTGTTFKGGTINLTELGLLDISKYASVTVDATLYTDNNCQTIAILPTGADDDTNLAQFSLLETESGWTNKIGNKAKDHMSVNGPTTWFIPEGASGVPKFLLIEANHDTAPETYRVNSIKVNKITFSAKTGADPVVYDWGKTTTELFETNTEWPGKSLPLSGASTITGTLRDLSSYKEIIVDATVYDRAGNVAVATKLIDQAFFVLLTDNSNWTTYETVKQYDMNVNGTTSVTPETNKVKEEDNRANRWTGIPTDIAFMGQYKAGKGNDEMVGKVELRSITFVPK
jgi:hypothetical protein